MNKLSLAFFVLEKYNESCAGAVPKNEVNTCDQTVATQNSTSFKKECKTNPSSEKYFSVAFTLMLSI